MPGYDPTGDLLLGGEAIANYLNGLLDPGSQVTLHRVYTWIETGYLPVRRIGNRVVGSKAALLRHLSPTAD